MKKEHATPRVLVALALATIVSGAPSWAATMDTAPSREATPTAAPPQVSELQHRGTGTIKKIDNANGKINIQHEAIKSLGWPAMTMDFLVQNKYTLATLKPGQQVEFDLVKGRGNQYVIARIAPLR